MALYSTANATAPANRLAQEKSPYLLQHAQNPVDWYPWGQEAFDKAKEENKPIFLSVGYSTCHWCHVMEHESFEDADVASVMNKHFVNIKVDREEHPGVDKLYMTYVQLTSGRGGWPMNVFLTPDLEPFFGGTYFAPDGAQQGRPGFKTVLQRVAMIWNTDNQKLLESGRDTIKQLQSFVQTRLTDNVDQHDRMEAQALATKAYDHYLANFDKNSGGFSKAPKFPQPALLQFLLEYFAYHDHDAQRRQHALSMVSDTLKSIARGGIHDHVGGGFHRYSTDENWHVPHFEKMLYDQGQLLSTYATAYQITKDNLFADTVRDIVRYVKKDLHHPQGGFYAAQDADSLPTTAATKKLEGAFCVWTKDELVRLLSPEQLQIVCHHYGVKDHGNVAPEQDPHNELTHQNVLHQCHSLHETASACSVSEEAAQALLEDAKAQLQDIRDHQRPSPHRDEKILTSWNGLMISGLVRSSLVVGDEALDLATETADFFHRTLYDPSTRTLGRSYCQSPSTIRGCLEDYSYLIQGLLDLYEAKGDDKWIQWAFDLQETQNDLFYDSQGGGFFSTESTDKSILVRLKDEQDGAEPSPNAVALKNLIRLGTVLEHQEYVAKAQDTLGCFIKGMEAFPYAMPSLVSCYLLMHHGTKQIVLAGRDTKPFKNLIQQVYMPNKLVIDGQHASGLVYETNKTVARITQEQHQSPGSASICEHFTCSLPISDLSQFQKQIQQ
ncbi:spermatogenesis-associated protein 20-like protein [Hesseltinella vesiculosa]|uniref:Spermatogenesis-associated protein 20-like protein n=1 Tax=Hesseltinella vesiculosa TaxID=101127 RepID=A0A1X2GXU9_9FUNG|nr:spermatogenesis-associated protein 20-like protein [Hesseltinella vesiculosa]